MFPCNLPVGSREVCFLYSAPLTHLGEWFLITPWWRWEFRLPLGFLLASCPLGGEGALYSLEMKISFPLWPSMIPLGRGGPNEDKSLGSPHDLHWKEWGCSCSLFVYYGVWLEVELFLSQSFLFC